MPDDAVRLDAQAVPAPLDYPFAPAVDDGVLLEDYVAPLSLSAGAAVGAGSVHLDDGAVAGLDDLLRVRGLAPCADRTLVVAVGSNAAPGVLLRKFTMQSVSVVVPLIRCRVTGIGLGYSAHVSKQGFVAASPFADPGCTQVLIGSLLDADQLAALDRTEPNYVRLQLPQGRYPLRIAGTGEQPAHWSVYESIHGVLAIDTAPVPLMRQIELHARLSQVPSVAAVAALGSDSAAALARLQQEDVREALKAHWRSEGHAIPSGLVGDAAPPRPVRTR